MKQQPQCALVQLVSGLVLLQGCLCDRVHISIEGWRFVPHSYAMVNQYQLLEMIKRPNLLISVEDKPYLKSWWKQTFGLFSELEEVALRNIPRTSTIKKAPDIVLRVAYPMDLQSEEEGKTWVFGTTEILTCIEEMKAQGDLKWEDVKVRIVTPSQWSKKGFINSGVDPRLVTVVPHGIDPTIFKPVSPLSKQRLRQRLGWNAEVSSSPFVFLSVGSTVGAKGMPALLEVFLQFHRAHRQARLVLKLQDGAYNSSLHRLTASNSQYATLIESGVIRYIGQSLTSTQMAELYQAADTYVSPYRGEGFNIPVLEAAACGTLVICTKGGSTEDFMLDNFTLKVAAELRPMQGRTLSRSGFWLVPNMEHLHAQMQRAMYDTGELRRRALKVGVPYVHKEFTWARAVDQLVSEFMTFTYLKKSRRGSSDSSSSSVGTCVE